MKLPYAWSYWRWWRGDADTEARGGDLTVLARMTCDRDPGQPWLKNASLLETRGGSSEQFHAVSAIHEQVRAAADRGKVRALAWRETYVGQRAVDRDGAELDGLTRSPRTVASEERELGTIVAIASLPVIGLLLLGGALPGAFFFWISVVAAAAIGLVFATWKFAGASCSGDPTARFASEPGVTPLVGAGSGAVADGVKALVDGPT